jgi:hypothetical protein
MAENRQRLRPEAFFRAPIQTKARDYTLKSSSDKRPESEVAKAVPVNTVPVSAAQAYREAIQSILVITPIRRS